MQDNIPIRKVKRRKKITFYNHGQITKQQLKIVMEITRQSSWLTAKTHFRCIVCLGAKFQPTEFTPKLGVKGKTVPMEMEIGSWQQAPSEAATAPSSTLPFPSSSHAASEPTAITSCPKQGIKNCPPLPLLWEQGRGCSPDPQKAPRVRQDKDSHPSGY